MKVLVAEDDMTSRKFLSKFISKYAHCDSVVDGVEALEAYILAIKEKEPYDLICLDIMMPKVDGVRVLEAIRQFEQQQKRADEEKVKVIMVTALNHSQYLKKAFDIGYDAYVSKPIDTDVFLKVLEDLEMIMVV